MTQPLKENNPAEKAIAEKKPKNNTVNLISIWFKQHQAACKNAIKHLISTPLSSLLTIFVVAIALSLPSALQVMIKNLESSQTSINEQAKITLFLKIGTSEADINALTQQLSTNDSLLEVRFISAEQALKDFQQSSNLGNTLSALKNNPLPASVVITPDTQKLTINDIEFLLGDYQALEAIDIAQIDVGWIKKLFSIIELAKHFAIGVSIFLVFAVLIIIGNTIRNLGQRFQEEIAISKLVGATDAYVRRIFLYSGLFYGLLGSIFGLTFVFIGILWVTPHVNTLAALYDTNINITGPGLNDSFSLIVIGIILGLGGAWVASNRIINRLSL